MFSKGNQLNLLETGLSNEQITQAANYLSQLLARSVHEGKGCDIQVNWILTFLKLVKGLKQEEEEGNGT